MCNGVVDGLLVYLFFDWFEYVVFNDVLFDLIMFGIVFN